MDRQSRLVAYLQRELNRPFIWGESDCALFVADWVALETGRDGAAELRGRYESEPDAARLMPRGLLDVVDQCARSIGLDRTSEPSAGDIAIIRAGDEVVCAIKAPSGAWAARLNYEMIFTSAGRVVAAWRVPERAGGSV